MLPEHTLRPWPAAAPPAPLLLTRCCRAGVAQVLASNVTALVWNTYMSFMSNRKVDVKKA